MNSVVSAASLMSASAVAASIPPTSQKSCSFPKLAERLDVLRGHWITLQEADNAEDRVFETALAEATGKPFGWRPARIDDNKQWKRVFEETRSKLPFRDPDLIEWSNLHDELFATGDQILAMPVRGLADVVVKAQAYALMHSEGWTQKTGLDQHEYDAVVVIEDICSMLSTSALPSADFMTPSIVAGGPAGSIVDEGSDLVFQAIENHKAAYIAHGESIRLRSAIEDKLFAIAAHRAEQRLVPRLAAEKTDPQRVWHSSKEEMLSHFQYEEFEKLADESDEYQEANEAYTAAAEADWESALSMARTVPTTRRGAVALVDYILVERQGDEILHTQGEDGYTVNDLLLESLASFLRAPAPRATQMANSAATTSDNSSSRT